MVDEIEAFYRERLPDFTTAATAIAGDEESGRDAVQEAFAKALRKRRRFRGDGSLEACFVGSILFAAALAPPRRPQGCEPAAPRRSRRLSAPRNRVMLIR
jgi:hypothetical protein